MIRNIALSLIAFAGLCWIGAAYIGITNASGEASASIVNTLNMFNGITMSSTLIAIAMGIWLKD